MLTKVCSSFSNISNSMNDASFDVNRRNARVKRGSIALPSYKLKNHFHSLFD